MFYTIERLYRLTSIFRGSPGAGAAALRAARVGTAGMEDPGNFAIGIKELGGVGGACFGYGVSDAVVDVPGPKACGEQTERRNEKTAVHAEKLVLVGSSLLEGANGLDARDEIDHDEHVSRAVS